MSGERRESAGSLKAATPVVPVSGRPRKLAKWAKLQLEALDESTDRIHAVYRDLLIGVARTRGFADLRAEVGEQRVTKRVSKLRSAVDGVLEQARRLDTALAAYARTEDEARFPADNVAGVVIDLEKYRATAKAGGR
jgi:hypothetical protein